MYIHRDEGQLVLPGRPGGRTCTVCISNLGIVLPSATLSDSKPRTGVSLESVIAPVLVLVFVSPPPTGPCCVSVLSSVFRCGQEFEARGEAMPFSGVPGCTGGSKIPIISLASVRNEFRGVWRGAPVACSRLLSSTARDFITTVTNSPKSTHPSPLMSICSDHHSTL